MLGSGSKIIAVWVNTSWVLSFVFFVREWLCTAQEHTIIFPLLQSHFLLHADILDKRFVRYLQTACQEYRWYFIVWTRGFRREKWLLRTGPHLSIFWILITGKYNPDWENISPLFTYGFCALSNHWVFNPWESVQATEVSSVFLMCFILSLETFDS